MTKRKKKKIFSEKKYFKKIPLYKGIGAKTFTFLQTPYLQRVSSVKV
jgi:hypothetical protein